jgi:hypothetical protein
MTDQIVSRTYMHAKGRAAYEAGKRRDEHHMNPGSPAILDFQDGWDRAKADRALTQQAVA